MICTTANFFNGYAVGKKEIKNMKEHEEEGVNMMTS